MNYINEEIKEVNLHVAISASESVFKCAADRITEGNLVFSYLNQDKVSGLIQVSVFKNDDYSNGINNDDYSVLIARVEDSVILSHVNSSYLENELLEKLKEYNVPQDILNTFVCMIENIKLYDKQ